MNGTREFGYRPALDGLRGIAILCVLGFHAGVPGFGGGSLGVDAFFVLSGFLITALLQQEWSATGRIDLPRFYARRALRLLPAAFSLLALLFVFSLTQPPAARIEQLHRELLFTLFYVANWALAFEMMEPLGFLGHTWSLAIEEQFYFLWPPVLLILLRLRIPRAGVAGFVVLVAALSALAASLLWRGPESIPRVFYGFDTRVQSLLVGCLAGLLCAWGTSAETHRRSVRSDVLSAGAAAVFATFVVFSDSTMPWMYKGGYSIVALGVAWITTDIASNEEGIAARVLRFRLLVAVGRISYGLYLWHWPVFFYVKLYRLDWSPAGIALFQILLSFAVAGLSYVCIERPFLRMKGRFAWKAV